MPKKIIDFFIDSAERSGIPNLKDKLKQVSRTKQKNKITYRFGSETFSVHIDGTWIYENDIQIKQGKLAPVYSPFWVVHMINSGLSEEAAKKDWERWKTI